MASSDRTFHSLAEYVDFGSAKPAGRAQSRETNPDTARFTGSASFPAAKELAHGWHEGAARVKRASATVKPKGRAARREVILREVGPGSLSMGNYLSGHPQPYVVQRDSASARNGKGKIIKLIVNLTASSGIATEVIERRGGAIVSLVTALESAGRRVEIVGILAINAFGSMKDTLTHRVTLKESFQKLNLPTLAFALAHPSMLRRIGFAGMEQESAEVRDALGIGYSYGMPCDIDAPKGAIYLPCMLYGAGPWDTAETATEWVTETAKAQGVTLKL